MCPALHASKARWLPILILAVFCWVHDTAGDASVPAAVVSSPPVEVTGGTVVGSVEQSAGGRPYYAYRAVPYAGSPEGEHRFKPPRPVDPWTGPLYTNATGPYCAQGARGYLRGGEDCLHLSVYTPLLPEGDKRPGLPVLVWLHGGAFVVSGAGDYDPRLMMDRNVVLVIPQYRLGILGFLYAMEASPGNYGLLDQAAALQWVRDNVAQFGGDPTRVTLGGDDAGGASALYHMIVPQSQGLFRGVVSVSGSPLNPWAQQMLARQSRMIFALRMGCPRHSSEAIVKCFKKLSLEKLLTGQAFVLAHGRSVGPDLMFTGNNNQAPVVQSSRISQHYRTLTEEPLVTLGLGLFEKVPVLLVGAKHEGNYVLNDILHEWALKQLARENVDDLVGDLINDIAERIGLKQTDAGVMAVVWKEYLGGMKEESYEVLVPGIAEMLGDALHNAGTVQTARYLSKEVPTYLMRFDFEDGPHRVHFNRSESTSTLPASSGAGHGDELHYFLPERFEPFVSSDQQRVSRIMLDTIDNFVNGRSLAPQWEPTTPEGLESAVLTKGATLDTGRYLNPNRQRAAEMIFRHHHRDALGRLGRRLQPRDEL